MAQVSAPSTGSSGVVLVAGQRREHGRSYPVADAISVEGPLQISLNSRPFTITMRTPGHDGELARGLLFAEGVIGRHDDFVCSFPSGVGAAATVDVSLPPHLVCENFFTRRSLLSTASCGLCGTREWAGTELDLPPLPAGARLSAKLLPQLGQRLQEEQTQFRLTGGCHGAAAFDPDGLLLALREDVGRHNAVDKVQGALLTNGRLADAAALFVSGRISWELALKAWRGGIAVLVAVSAPSSLAIEFGQRTGLCLVGFCREGRATVYSHPERLAEI